jgi:DNA-binding NarL/FixJ family response regulator
LMGSGPRCVLIWSDDTAEAQRVAGALAPLRLPERAGVACCDNAEEMMAAVLDDRADVLIADLGSGSQRTVTALRNVKRVRPRLPMIVLTSVFDERFRTEVLPLGIHCYLLRDFETDELFESVRSAFKACSSARTT